MIGKIRNKKGQVAVEFILTFSVVIVLFILLYRYSLSVVSLQYHQYITFMAARSAASGTQNYADKVTNIQSTITQYRNSEGVMSNALVSGFVCSNDGGSPSQRGNLAYNTGKVDYSLGANAGIACKISMTPLTSKVDFVSEAMLGSAISEDHCKCLLDFTKTWKDCLNEGGGNKKSISDNGC